MADLASWREEMRSAFLYRVMAESERDVEAQRLFLALADAAERQAKIWLSGKAQPAFAPDTRALLVAQLVRFFGPKRMRTALAAMKVRGLSIYATQLPEAAAHQVPRDVSELGRRHRGLDRQGNLRASVFGLSDGLVSNASLIAGMAGAAAADQSVLLAGVAGLVAGAFSMAAGEWISVKSQRELFEFQIALERDELEKYPNEEAAELALIYEAKGIASEQAQELARVIIASPVKALDTLAREELGLNPDELGSPFGAAFASFVSFGLGALVPLLPLLLKLGALALPLSVGLSAVALFGIGAALSLFSGRTAIYGGLRMLAIGASAGAATYGLGHLLGVSLG